MCRCEKIDIDKMHTHKKGFYGKIVTCDEMLHSSKHGKC